MAITNILGSVGFISQGTYSASTTYNYLNAVRQNSHWYVCRVKGGITNLPPASTFVDNTQWLAFAESSANALTTISRSEMGNKISITREGLSTFEFYDGHIIMKEGGTGLTHRDTLQYKSDNITVSNIDTDTTQVDFTPMDTKIASNVGNTDNLTGATGDIKTITNVSNTSPTGGQALTFNTSASEYRPSSIVDVNQVNKSEYETRRDGAGWIAGDLMTPTENFGVIRLVGSPTIIDYTFAGAALVSNGHATMTNAIGIGKFFEPVTGAGSLVQFRPSIRGSAAVNLPNGSNNYVNPIGTQYSPYSNKPSTIAIAYTETAAQIQAVTDATTAGNVTDLASETDVGGSGITINGFVNAVATADKVTLTATRTGNTLIASGSTTSATVTVVQAGVDDTLQLFIKDRIYQRTAANGWFEYVPNALNTIATGGNI